MSNSGIINYIKISPNKTVNRNHKIDTITIHCVVGQVSVERLGEIFANPKRKASSNYGVGFDGRIGMYVEEKDRSHCSSSATNDNRAITIEVASDTKHPYKVTSEAYQGLIRLLVDICRRNNIDALRWAADKNLIGQVDKQNMTVHRWFAKKACPGDYLFNLHSQIAYDVNAILNPKEIVVTGVKEQITPIPAPIKTIVHIVKKGESLSKIAQKYNTTVAAIANKNKIKDVNKIYVGQKLTI